MLQFFSLFKHKLTDQIDVHKWGFKIFAEYNDPFSDSQLKDNTNNKLIK